MSKKKQPSKVLVKAYDFVHNRVAMTAIPEHSPKIVVEKAFALCTEELAKDHVQSDVNDQIKQEVKDAEGFDLNPKHDGEGHYE